MKEEPWMSEKSPVVERADALMQRRRSTAAAPLIPPSSPAVKPPRRDEDEIPVLHEVVPTPFPDQAQAPDLTGLSAELTEAVRQQLIVELPMLLEATMITASEELRIGILETMENAMRQFAAQHPDSPHADKESSLD